MSNNTSTSSSIVQALPTTVPSTETTTTNTATTPTAPTAGLCSKNFECLFVTFMIGLIVFIILLVVFRMCCVYMVLRRRMPISRPNRTSQRENDTAPRDIEDIGHPFSYLAHEGFDNSGFVPPPPRYDELFKGDEPPPMYETVTTQAAIQTSPRRDVMEIERPLQTNSSQLRNSVRIQQSQNVQSSSNLAVQTSLTMLPTGAFGTSIPPTNEYYEEDFGSIRLRGDTISSIAHSIPSTYIPPTTITLPRNDTISHQTNHSTEREDLHGSQYFDAVEPISQERLDVMVLFIVLCSLCFSLGWSETSRLDSLYFSKSQDGPHITRHSPFSQIYKLGYKLQLLCEARGTPRPTLRWYKNNEEVEPTERATIRISLHGEVVSSFLQLAPTNVLDSAEYHCVAANKNGVHMQTFKVHYTLR